MRSWWGRAGAWLALGGVSIGLTVTPVRAAAPTALEKGLLGIRILSKYNAVLARFGQPSRVYRAGETILVIPKLDAKGDPTGGVASLEEMADGGGGPGGGRGSAGGYPGSGGGPSSGGRSGSGGYGSRGGYPSSGGGPSSSGGSGGGGRSSGSGGGNGDENTTFAESGGYTWAYFYPAKELLYAFFFTADDRVIGIIEIGRNNGLPTRRGVSLGTPVSTLYARYGWPSDIFERDVALNLNYGPRNHASFAVYNNKVVGIGVFLTENIHVNLFPTNNSGSGGGGGGASSGPRGGGGPRGGKGGAGAPTAD